MKIRLEKRNFQKMTMEAQNNSKTIVGYAVKWDKPSQTLKTTDGKQFIEIFKRGAFSETLLTEDQRALWNHDTSNILGRVKSGTLRLEEDDVGLRFELDLPDTTQGNDIYELVKRGDIDGVSFGFKNPVQNWKKDNQIYVRTITKAKLYEISCVTFPAYSDSEVNVRSTDIKILNDDLKKRKELLLKTFL